MGARRALRVDHAGAPRAAATVAGARLLVGGLAGAVLLEDVALAIGVKLRGVLGGQRLTLLAAALVGCHIITGTRP